MVRWWDSCFSNLPNDQLNKTWTKGFTQQSVRHNKYLHVCVLGPVELSCVLLFWNPKMSPCVFSWTFRCHVVASLCFSTRSGLPLRENGPRPETEIFYWLTGVVATRTEQNAFFLVIWAVFKTVGGCISPRYFEKYSSFYPSPETSPQSSWPVVLISGSWNKAPVVQLRDVFIRVGVTERHLVEVEVPLQGHFMGNPETLIY